MEKKEFENVVERRIQLIRKVLTEKNKEYSITSKSVFHNFIEAGQIRHSSPENALINFMTKHLVSLFDIVNKLDEVSIDGNSNLPQLPVLEEKIGDTINYFVLLEGMIKERIFNADPKAMDDISKSK